MNKTESQKKIMDAAKTIFSYCLKRTPTREDAEDLSQDILIELLKSIENIRDDNAFYAFMWGVAGNVYKQWYRKELKHSTSELTEDLPADNQFQDDDGSDIFLLRRELALLSERYRKATVLYYIGGRSCSEISSELTVSESMVKYLLFKSRKILKEGMNMERNLGELSYNPKTLFPMYHGQGPNRFWQFMQNKIRQNIVCACYNDALTVQQVSLETGIPLPYLEDEIKALEDKQIIIKDKDHYKSNIIIITTECADKIEQSVMKYHNQIADKIEIFISNYLDEYKKLAFKGSDFSENTLRWQIAAVLFRMINRIDYEDEFTVPKTGWGECAFLWCQEKLNEMHIFSYCGVDGKRGDSLYFWDYLNGGKGNHQDFYGKERYINIFCDICRGEYNNFSEYDLEAIAEMIRNGYVLKENETFRSTTTVYTYEQYKSILNTVTDFINRELMAVIREMDSCAADILSDYTPKHLQNQIRGIASMDKFINAICVPATILIDRHFLNTAWNPCEMPTTYAVLK